MTIQQVFIAIYEGHLVIQVALLAYIIGLPGKGPVKRKLTLVVGWYAIYALASIFLARATFEPHIPVGTEVEFSEFQDLYGISYAIWLGMVMTLVTIFLMACLDFWYALLERKRDWQFWFFYALSVVAICLYLTVPDKIIYDNPSTGKALGIFYLPGQFYGLWLLWRGLRKLPEGIERRRLRVILWAFLVPILAVFIVKA